MVQAYKLNKKLIIRDEYGQLGNILFRLGNALAFALEHGYRVEDYTLAFCNYHDGSSNIRFFESCHPFHFFEYPKPKFRFLNRLKWKMRLGNKIGIQKVENFDTAFDLRTLPPKCSYELKGFHFSSGNLVTKHRNEICKILRFSSSHIEPTQDLIKQARIKYSVLLGVHIRQKDFKEFHNGLFFITPDSSRM